jgi:putative hemolysin
MGSVKTLDPVEVTGVFKAFDELGQVDHTFNIPARHGHQVPDFASILSKTADGSKFQDLVPPLLKSYIRAGAVIAGDPAVDLDFGCCDLFVIMDRERLNAAYSRKYQSH